MTNVLDKVSNNLRAILDDPPERPWVLDDDDIDQLTTEEREQYAEQVDEYTIGVLVRHAHLLGRLDSWEAREEEIQTLHALLAQARESDELGGQLRRMLASRNRQLSDELAEVRFAQEVEEHNYEQGRRIEEQRAAHDRIRHEEYKRYLNTYGTSTDLFRHVARSLTDEHGRPPTIEELAQQLFELTDESVGPDVAEEHVRSMVEAGDLECEERISVPYGSDDAWVRNVMEGDDG